MAGRRAFSLPELTLAMAMASIVAMAVVAAGSAFSSAHANTMDYYQSLHGARGGVMKASAIIRRARLVIAAEADSLTLWLDDANDDGKINPSELAVMHFDADSGELRLATLRYPDYLGHQQRAALDSPLDLSALVGSGLGLLSSSPHFHQQVLVEAVSGCSFTADPSAPLSRLVAMEISVQEGARAITLRSASSLRADVVRYVGVSGGQYVLAEP